jgi:mRNA interferase RelE/StbE
MIMYRIEIEPRARKEIRRLPIKDQDRVFAVFEELSKSPFSGKKLGGVHDGVYSLRVWPYRILYTIDRQVVLVTIVRVAHRKDAYR